MTVGTGSEKGRASSEDKTRKWRSFDNEVEGSNDPYMKVFLRIFHVYMICR